MNDLIRNPLNILVADDCAAARRMIIDAMSSIPVQLKIIEKDNGNDCLEALSTGIFQLAFIDIYMPQMDGLEALALSRSSGDKTFVVIISSISDQERYGIAKQLNAYDYLTKPFQSTDITTIINNYIRFNTQSSVLIVDDSTTVRRVIKKVLNQCQFKLQIDEAAEGMSALTQYRKKDYDIIFLDINMPGMDGIDVLKQMRKINEDAKAILMTGDRSEKLAASVKDLGVRFFLYKPFYFADVDRVLHEWYDLKPPGLEAVNI